MLVTRKKYRQPLVVNALALVGQCVLVAGLSVGQAQAQSTPSCASAASDIDNDGWGWENNRSCVVVDTAVQATGNLCTAAAIDPDGDGWGWENNRSCVIDSSASAANIVTSKVTGFASCESSLSDENADGYGWENGQTCVVTSASSSTVLNSVTNTTAAPPPVAAANVGWVNGNPICLTDSSDTGNDGFGFENNSTCVVVDGVTATRSAPLLNQRSCIPWLEIGYGNYRLQNNTWNDGAVYSDNWSQCIELQGSPGNYVAKWDYNWLQRSQGDEYAVKSYPQVYYGRKTRYNLSGSVAETGLPVSINSMPQFYVDYDYSETGIVERNVALESFFHTSCEAEEHNKQFEMMVWVGVPNIRTPGVQVSSVTLSGQDWDVYTNPTLGWAYVAFVAQNPHNAGTLDWNAFVNWSRYQGPAFGVPAMGQNTCMGAIEIGSETFWGTGTFTLNNFQVRR